MRAGSGHAEGVEVLKKGVGQGRRARRSGESERLARANLKVFFAN